MTGLWIMAWLLSLGVAFVLGFHLAVRIVTADFEYRASRAARRMREER